MSSYETITIFHLRDLATGKRSIIKCVDVKVFTIPHYKGLTIETMLEFASDYDKISQALPSESREVMKLARAYVANIIYTLVDQAFADWVDI